MNTIEIPQGKEIDWKQSEKENRIVLKNKYLTYEDVCKKLFKNKEFFFTNNTGVIESSSPVSKEYLINAKNNSTSYHQLECIMAKNMLANIAKYLNDGWKPLISDCFYIIRKDDVLDILDIDYWKYTKNNFVYGEIIFKSKERAQQAINILGEETIKLALEPLGI